MVRPRWTEAQNHYESLAVSVRAALAGYEMDRQYDELVATLGLGALTVATSEDPLGWWCTYARDAHLVQTAQLFGLRLRELHPPAAAAGLSHSAEYAEHFRDSYVPLIARALGHGQLVLAWRGWPAPRERLWGIVTEARGETLFGHTLWHDGQSLPLTGPAHQVYIVEEYRQPKGDTITHGALFRHVARQAHATWKRVRAAQADLKTGEAAYRAWQEALRNTADHATHSLPLYRQQSQAARVHVAARSYLGTWLRRVAGALAGEQLELAAHWANTCDRVGQRLLPYESPEVVRELLSQRGGAEHICRAIREVCEMEGALFRQLQAIA